MTENINMAFRQHRMHTGTYTNYISLDKIQLVCRVGCLSITISWSSLPHRLNSAKTHRKNKHCMQSTQCIMSAGIQMLSKILKYGLFKRFYEHDIEVWKAWVSSWQPCTPSRAHSLIQCTVMACNLYWIAELQAEVYSVLFHRFLAFTMWEVFTYHVLENRFYWAHDSLRFRALFFFLMSKFIWGVFFCRLEIIHPITEVELLKNWRIPMLVFIWTRIIQ